jgi:hypothetical protein
MQRKLIEVDELRFIGNSYASVDESDLSSKTLKIRSRQIY